MNDLSRADREIQRKVANRRTSEDALSLEITLLGDGRGTPEYQKRLELQERLQQHRFVSHVTIPEQLSDRHPQATADEIERSAIEQADVVLCIESPARSPLGLYTEVFGYFDSSNPDKWYRCRPMERADASGEDALVAGLADPRFRSIETFDYEPREWELCGRITARCEQRIDVMAHRKLDPWKAAQP